MSCAFPAKGTWFPLLLVRNTELCPSMGETRGSKVNLQRWSPEFSESELAQVKKQFEKLKRVH